jgi:L-fucose isomerase-like protein
MSMHNDQETIRSGPGIETGSDHIKKGCGNLNRRGFLGGLGGMTVLGGLALTGSLRLWADLTRPTQAMALAASSPLRVKPVLVYQLHTRREYTSWRPYGGLQTRDDVDREAKRIQAELKEVAAKADFGLEILPLALVASDAELGSAKASDGDMFLVYAAGGAQQWLEALAATKKPNVMFLRHRSGPIYLWYEIAHWRFLRKSEDAFREPHMDIEDIVVDEYGEVLWRLRALHGLRNTLGTKVMAIGGLQAYSRPGEVHGPDHAQKVWKFELKQVSFSELEQRLKNAREDKGVMEQIQDQTAEFLAQKNVTLQTDRQSVVNSFLALRVFKEIMSEAGATNLGVAQCMGGLIRLLQTPPCLILSLLNDEGYTAFCHADLTHTVPGVLLHHVSGKPSFVSNTHFPHHGIMTLAHCSAPRKMNGKDYEPTKILTHFESDSGAATKVEYPKNQLVTTLIPNLVCTKWVGFKARIVDSPAHDICRSQMDLAIEGDWRKLLADMQGFHAITCYGDYLREIGYVLKKMGVEWENVSQEFHTW